MVKRGIVILFSLIFGIFLIASVNAAISFSNVRSSYNFGDLIDVQAVVNPVQSASMLNTQLICGGVTVFSTSNYPMSSQGGQISIDVPVTYETLQNNIGDCYFSSSYGTQTQTSRKFTISKELDVSLDVDSFFIKPGDSVTVSGQALRLDGSGADGVIEVTIPVNVLKDSNLSVPTCLDLANSSTPVNRTDVLNQNLIAQNEFFSGSVSNGTFLLNQSFPTDVSAGDYKITADVYETSSSGNKTNEGIVYGDLKVSQVPTKIEIVENNDSFEPGENLSFKATLLDQTGYEISDDVASIISLNNTKIYEKVVSSGEILNYDFPTNISSGYYTITSTNNNIIAQKTFFISEKAYATFIVSNGTLVITNMGNILYDKDIEIDLNGQSFVKHVTLGLGESKEFKLTGLNDKYDIKVSDGENQMTQQGVILTGNAIAVNDPASGMSLIASQPIFWIFLLIIILAIVLFIYRDYFRKKSVAKPNDNKSKTIVNNNSKGIITFKGTGEASQKPAALKLEGGKDVKSAFSGNSSSGVSARRDFRQIGDSSIAKIGPSSGIVASASSNRSALGALKVSAPRPDPNKMVKIGAQESNKVVKIGSDEVEKTNSIAKFYPMPVAIPTQAEQALVTDGQKSVSTLMLIKIKSPLTKIAKETIERAISVVYEKKGAVSESGDFIYVIFSPLVTKTFKNEITAARCAQDIVREIKEYNSKFREKIKFGIGINTGEIINKIEDKKLKFTALGNVLPIAKRLADGSDDSIFLARPAYEKAMTEIKAVKVTINGTEAFEIKQIVDYDKNKKFIEDFMKRERVR